MQIADKRPQARRQRKSKNTVTMANVACAAGVSLKTVSRVLNNEPHVRPIIKKKVQAAVDSLGFRPNASARALAGARSYLIGLYFNNTIPGYVSQVQLGAMKACRDHDYHLVVEELSGSSDALVEQVHALQKAIRVDGVVLMPPLCDDAAVLTCLEAAGMPYVRIAPAGSQAPGQSPKVYMDDRRAAYEMTNLLVAQGHRDIAFISGPANHAAASMRRDGFVASMTEAGLAVAPQWLQTGDFSFRDGLEIGERLISGHPRPTAIFAANDDMALGVMAVAHRWRLDIPKFLSIVGFDDSPGAQVVWPQLTTVRQPVAEMAATAVEMLVGAQTGDELPAARQLDFAIVVRDSAGPPLS
jgi:LacI family transcriptional regulator